MMIEYCRYGMSVHTTEWYHRQKVDACEHRKAVGGVSQHIVVGIRVGLSAMVGLIVDNWMQEQMVVLDYFTSGAVELFWRDNEELHIDFGPASCEPGARIRLYVCPLTAFGQLLCTQLENTTRPSNICWICRIDSFF